MGAAHVSSPASLRGALGPHVGFCCCYVVVENVFGYTVEDG